MGLFSSSKSDSDGSEGSPPAYDDSFIPTTQLQVQAIGYDMNQAITGRTLENISIHSVESGESEYVSIRQKKSSNSCALVRASDPGQTLISTIYRFGPGRHPKMHLFPSNSGVSVEQALDKETGKSEEVKVKSHSLVSRGQVFDTSLGKFEWRYSSRAERKALNADSLLILDRVDGDSSSKGSCTQIAQLIRNDQFRTPGTVRYSGGNGGRLMMDLRMWSSDEKVIGGAEAFIVASCILMLKREADRFIQNNIAAVT